jgi:hypothetical protein
MSQLDQVIAECVPLILAMGSGRCAVTMGGSRGKQTADERSDIDFRLFCDETVGKPYSAESPTWPAFCAAVERWRDMGVNIDYVWVRTVADIDTQLDSWLRGDMPKVDHVWTLWGYHFLTDIGNQVVISDPDGLIATWQARLVPYPMALQQAIFKKYAGSLRYWRHDYHYRNKVERGDVVFLASITPRLINDIMQVLFALNQTYYVGDGNNLYYCEKFAVLPVSFVARVTEILYPAPHPERFAHQYTQLGVLIDDVLALIPA